MKKQPPGPPYRRSPNQVLAPCEIPTCEEVITPADQIYKGRAFNKGGWREAKGYEDWMPGEIIKVMGQGGSMIQAMIAIGISRDRFFHWVNPKHNSYIPEIREAYENGKALSQCWWERNAQVGIWGGKQFNCSTFQFLMKNRFKADYGDKAQVDINISGDEKMLAALNATAQKDWSENDPDQSEFKEED